MQIIFHFLLVVYEKALALELQNNKESPSNLEIVFVIIIVLVVQ